MHHLFTGIDDDSLDGTFAPVSVDGYSQAFTPFGNIQAKGTMPAFQGRISFVNGKVSRQGEHTAIRAPNMQAYTYQSHRTRFSAASHVAQTGQFTQLLAGTHKSGDKVKRIFERLRTRLNIAGMPHEGLETLVNDSDPELANQFRLEVVYVVHMDQIEPSLASGRCVTVFSSFTLCYKY